MEGLRAAARLDIGLRRVILRLGTDADPPPATTAPRLKLMEPVVRVGVRENGGGQGATRDRAWRGV